MRMLAKALITNLHGNSHDVRTLTGSLRSTAARNVAQAPVAILELASQRTSSTTRNLVLEHVLAITRGTIVRKASSKRRVKSKPLRHELDTTGPNLSSISAVQDILRTHAARLEREVFRTTIQCAALICRPRHRYATRHECMAS